VKFGGQITRDNGSFQDYSKFRFADGNFGLSCQELRLVFVKSISLCRGLLAF
jgi:hypothetical protein